MNPNESTELKSTGFKSALPWIRGFGEPILAAWACSSLVKIAFGDQGLFPQAWSNGLGWKLALYLVLMTHLTISAMSLCFHRMHTHQGVKLHPVVDMAMQAWLWFTTSMSKRDWVSVHAYHHAHSDQELDPHSPVLKGLARVFFLGALDYTRAKNSPEVMKIKKRIRENRFEKFIGDHLFVGPIVFMALMLVAFGPLMGTVVALSTFMISPIFAVGGVNALAHHIGYRNYETTDNSRNLGFLVPLNWMICGELDHNNHHAHPGSCSFRHKFYEFDIGFFYLRLLSFAGLAHLRTVYRPKAVTAAPRARVDSRLHKLQGFRA